MWSDTPPLRDMQFVQGWTMYPGLLQGRQADDARCGLASWHTGAPKAIPAVGGAMALCARA